MTSIDYPGVLPLPLVNSASYVEKSHLISTDIDSGYAVVRKRFTKVPVFFDLGFLMSVNDAGLFESWYANQLDYGLNYFNIEVPVGGNIRRSHVCRIIGKPNFSLNGNHFNVTIRVEAQELGRDPEYDDVILGWADDLGTLGDVTTWLEGFDTLVNTTYPASGYGPNA
jgi:hypothetical protein